MIYVKAPFSAIAGFAMMLDGCVFVRHIPAALHGAQMVSQENAFGGSLIVIGESIITFCAGWKHEHELDYDSSARVQLLCATLAGCLGLTMLASALMPNESRFNCEITFVAMVGIQFLLGVILFFPSFGWRRWSIKKRDKQQWPGAI